jgi:uncharacterized BrkB/YihY/UPF0761 family membrane protein
MGKTLIAWYLQNSQVGSAWGSAASWMVALLVWVYYSSLIVLFGAELTQAWAKNYGHGIQLQGGRHASRGREEASPWRSANLVITQEHFPRRSDRSRRFGMP